MIAETDEKLAAILAFDGQDGYDLLKSGHVALDKIDMVVFSDHVETFDAFLAENEIDYLIATENVKEAIDEEATRQAVASTTRGLSFDAFMRYDAVCNALQPCNHARRRRVMN